MPSYSFKKISSGEEWEQFMSISAMESLMENKDIQQILSFPAIISGVDRKPDSGFRDVLKRVKKASGLTNKINTF